MLKLCLLALTALWTPAAAVEVVRLRLAEAPALRAVPFHQPSSLQPLLLVPLSAPEAPPTPIARADIKIQKTMTAIAATLSPDLLKPAWRGKSENPLAGHCYAASEALYHRLGGKAAGWTPQVVRHQGGTHWFLKHASGKVADITAGQFEKPVPYARARGVGFLTRRPSKRAREILRRLAK